MKKFANKPEKMLEVDREAHLPDLYIGKELNKAYQGWSVRSKIPHVITETTTTKMVSDAPQCNSTDTTVDFFPGKMQHDKILTNAHIKVQVPTLIVKPAYQERYRLNWVKNAHNKPFTLVTCSVLDTEVETWDRHFLNGSQGFLDPKNVILQTTSQQHQGDVVSVKGFSVIMEQPSFFKDLGFPLFINNHADNSSGSPIKFTYTYTHSPLELVHFEELVNDIWFTVEDEEVKENVVMAYDKIKIEVVGTYRTLTDRHRQSLMEKWEKDGYSSTVLTTSKIPVAKVNGEKTVRVDLKSERCVFLMWAAYNNYLERLGMYSTYTTESGRSPIYGGKVMCNKKKQSSMFDEDCIDVRTKLFFGDLNREPGFMFYSPHTSYGSLIDSAPINMKDQNGYLSFQVDNSGSKVTKRKMIMKESDQPSKFSKVSREDNRSEEKTVALVSKDLPYQQHFLGSSVPKSDCDVSIVVYSINKCTLNINKDQGNWFLETV